MQVEAKAKAMVGLADSNDKNVPKGNLLQPWQANVDNLRAHEQYKHPWRTLLQIPESMTDIPKNKKPMTGIAKDGSA